MATVCRYAITITSEQGMGRFGDPLAGFWQRFSGTLTDDGSSIRASWEKSPDGSSWEHDFDLIYSKVT